MGEVRLVVDHMKLEYKGIFSTREMFRMFTRWFKENAGSVRAGCCHAPLPAPGRGRGLGHGAQAPPPAIPRPACP